MYSIAMVIISFLFIPILIRLKFKLSHSLLITALILGILSGAGPLSLVDSIINVFKDSSSMSTILSVMMVSILGGLMKQYNLFDKIVSSMLKVINNKKAILMIIPSMIGLLVVPGGALLSAPFVNDIGKELNIPTSRRAAINLVFRHMAILLLPYSTSLLVISGSLPNIHIPTVLSLNLIFVIFMYGAGYFLYLKDIKVEKTMINHKYLIKNILNLFFYTSPIYACVIIYSLTALPFYITLFASIILVYLIGDKKDFLKTIVNSFNLNTVLSVIAIFIIKGIIVNMEDLTEIFNQLFLQSQSLFSVMAIFLVTSFFFGFITGNQLSSLAIILPMISQLSLSNHDLNIYTFFAFASSFLGYYFSPLHLCQVFTLQHMEARTGELYKEYRFLLPFLLLVLITMFYILN